MSALYIFVGLALGIALTEAVRWRLGSTGKQTTQRSVQRRSYSPVRLSARDGGPSPSSRHFAAQDYYDR